MKFSLSALAATLLPQTLRRHQAAGAIKRIYLAPDDHSDYLWSADEDTYRQVFLEMLDYYLDQMDATQGNPSIWQSRWNCDGSFWIWTYEKNRTAAQFERLISRIRDGHISFPMNALVVCPGGAPLEAVLRGMYYAGALERRFHLRVRLAAAMENQTLPYGLGALWAGSGVRYSWKGICGCASQVQDAWDRENEIYWWVGADGSKILMKWNSMLGSNQELGGYAEARDPDRVVEYAASDSSFQARYPYSVIGAFGQGWDDLRTLSNEFLRVAQNQSNSQRQVIVSNQIDFFQDFEANHGAELPSVSASFGNEWDLYCASMAETSARVKRAVEKLRSAEALSTLVSLNDPGFLNDRVQGRQQAFMDLGLYWEHCWTADGPVSRAARRDWQNRLAASIESYVENLQDDAVQALGRQIRNPGGYTRFFVFNPLSWARSGAADFPEAPEGPFRVVDISNGQEAPSQIVNSQGVKKLRILAQDVPPVGYKIYEIMAGAGQTYSDAGTVGDGTIETEAYRITVSERGAITSLVDKTRGNREFVRTVNGRAVNDLGAGDGRLYAENIGPVSVTLRAEASNPLRHITRITLTRNLDWIEISNEIDQNFGDLQTWAFSFELDNPDVWHEEVGAIIRARLLNQGGHYSPRNARYDWLTINHFADMSDGPAGMTLSNADCYYMKLGNSSAGALDARTPQISVLAGGQADGETLGIPNQGGETHFLQRFALRAHGDFDPLPAMKFSLEHQNPLVTGLVTGGMDYPSEAYSFLTISNPKVLLWALKPHEDGDAEGIVVRLWNLSPSGENFSLRLPAYEIQSAGQLTHIETPAGEAQVTSGALAGAMNRHQIKTYNLHITRQTSRPGCSDHCSYQPNIRKR